MSDNEEWLELVKLRYKVLSEMGMDAIEDIISRFRENNGKTINEKGYDETYGYWHAVRDHYIDWLKDSPISSEVSEFLKNK